MSSTAVVHQGIDPQVYTIRQP